MSRSVKVKPIISLVILTGLIAGGGLAYRWWNQPAVSKPLNVATTSNVLGSDTELKPWQTAYFSTQIPSFLRVRSSLENPNRSQIGQYSLANTLPSKTDQVAITVGTLGNGSLAELSAVRLRQAQSNLYTADNRGYVPGGGLVFSRTDSYETAVFWQHGGQYVAVVVGGTIDRKPDLETSLAAIVANWQWK